MSNETVRATVYLQVQPEYLRWMPDHSKPESVSGAKVVRSTQKRSAAPEPGTVEVKLTIELPKTAFTPLAPEAIVVIPESLTQPHPITVEAADANEDN
ncbi:hypothetical protein [Streptomyces sp. AC495_CC817]|uniref:hypothetical protein n=1 Tax=Streptomyces sp. AC495_CC817 TaxID=2823900 RepID=UPI001C2778B5|nr:hypothetical protein [Streptomyces sp. AC495_CC817]